uniref:Uncharacterized protein n=1 Tax=Romanomermis culicivorax TaxID=13658 RepID=A0A915IT55_ROMCU
MYKGIGCPGARFRQADTLSENFSSTVIKEITSDICNTCSQLFPEKWYLKNATESTKSEPGTTCYTISCCKTKIFDIKNKWTINWMRHKQAF